MLQIYLRKRMFTNYLTRCFVQNGDALFDMGIRGAWRLGYTGRGIVLSLIGLGMQWNHTDLIANYVFCYCPILLSSYLP